MSNNVPHEYGPSRVGHGEVQCKWCLGTNRENAVLRPNHCEARELRDPYLRPEPEAARQGGDEPDWRDAEIERQEGLSKTYRQAQLTAEEKLCRTAASEQGWKRRAEYLESQLKRAQEGKDTTTCRCISVDRSASSTSTDAKPADTKAGLSPPAPDEVEAVAQFLHDEGGFDEAWDATWPEHAEDTGQRDGGFVRIVPTDVQAKFRDVARRLLSGRAALEPRPRERVPNLCDKIFDHKWLDPECVEIGCKSLLPRRLAEEIAVMEHDFDKHTNSWLSGFARARQMAVKHIREALEAGAARPEGAGE